MIFSKARILGLFCIVGTLVGAVLVLRNVGEGGALDRLDGLLRADVLAALLLLYACHFLAEPLRWTLYCRHPAFGLPHSGARFGGIFACFNVTALLSYSLPFKLGLPLRLLLLSQFLGLDSGASVRLMVIDGAFSLVCWAALAAAMLLFIPELGGFLAERLDPVVLVGALAVALAVALLLLRWKGAQLLARLRLVPPGVAAAVVLTLAVDILLYGARHLVLGDALDLGVSAGALFASGIVAVFLGIVSTLPMGLGAYDASLVGLLALYGVEPELGLLLAFANRLCMIATSILLGVPSALLMLKKGIGVTEGGGTSG